VSSLISLCGYPGILLFPHILGLHVTCTPKRLIILWEEGAKGQEGLLMTLNKEINLREVVTKMQWRGKG